MLKPEVNNTEKSTSATECKGVHVPWKEYLEPIDLNRNLSKVHPIEVDYYHNFVDGLVREIENLGIGDNIYTYSQLDMPKNLENVENGNGEQPQKLSRNDLLLSSYVRMLKEPPKEDLLRLEILEQSTLERHQLKSAEQYEFLAAITTAKVGDVFDMERFELLGDAFLKFACSLYLANRYPTWNEGYLSNVKGCMVSNRNLLYCMLDTDLCRRICGTPFTPNICWIPPLSAPPSNLLEYLESASVSVNTLTPLNLYSLNLSEKEIQEGVCDPVKLNDIKQAIAKRCHDDAEKGEKNGNGGTITETEADCNGMSMFVNKQTLQDKTVADTLEAILGVCVKNYGIQETFQLLEFFGIVKPRQGESLKNLLELDFSGVSQRTQMNSRDIDKLLINYEYLERNLGYKFRNRAYLLQAVTHPSYPTNRLTGCYQELEFVGDAILDMLITAYIFERFQSKTPGKITDLRMALVNNVTLACCCVRHRFHLFLLYENVSLSELIKTFADFQETQRHSVTNNVRLLMEEEDVSGSLNDSNNFETLYEMVDSSNPDNKDKNTADGGGTYNIADNVEVPKVLGDLVESLIAAVYLDSRDLKQTWRVVYNLMEKEIKEFEQNIPVDPVRELMEMQPVHAEFSSPISKDGLTMIICCFNCLDERKRVHAFGNNARQAKKAAAKAALKILLKKSK